MKKITSLSLVLMFLLGGLILVDFGSDIISHNATGATLYVGGTGGGNYSSIQAAINDANSGDTVYVFQGEYAETLFINKTLNLEGENRSTTVIDTSGGTYGIHLKDADYINISGLAIKGASFNIKITSSNNNHINNNIISESGTLAISVSPGSYNLIENNEIKNNFKGIDISESSSYGNIVKNNEFESIKDRAISLQQNAFDNMIEDNTFSNYDVGIYIYESEGNTIKNCQLNVGNESIRIINVVDILFENNHISDNVIAIKILDNANITMSNCSIANSGSTDFLLGDAVYGNANVKLYNTTFDKDKVEILDSQTSLSVYWYLHVNVVDKDDNPQPGISVMIRDNDNGIFNETVTTDSQGDVDWITLLGFFENQTGRVNYDPYNITAYNLTQTGYAVPEVVLDNSKKITVKVSPNVVEVENRPPEITVIEPVSSTPEIEEGTTLIFTIQESDLDPEDTLQITWFLDDVLAQTDGSSFTYMADYLSSGDHVIKVVVSDGTIDVEQSWTVTVQDKSKEEEHTGLSYDQMILLILIVVVIFFTIFLILIYNRRGKKQVPFDGEDENN
jgi:parallel beta-helix repeat protein